MSDKSRALAIHAMLLAAALILSWVEAMLPPIGGFRLGLANIAVVLAVQAVSRRCGLSVMLCRVIITSILFGSATTFAFSLGGGLLSLGVSAMLKPAVGGKLSLLGVSVLAAAAHNLGQVLAACALMESAAPLGMLWWLLLLSLPAGIVTGFLAEVIFNRVKL